MELTAAAELARRMLDQYGLRTWRFRFDRAVRRFGTCHHRRATITLSAPLTLLNPEAEVRDTILHEIAHAIAGPDAGHGAEWRKYATLIGARPERCFDERVRTPPSRYIAYCPNCRKEYRRQRAPSTLHACSNCCQRFNDGQFSEAFTLVFRFDEAHVCIVNRKLASAEAFEVAG